MSKVGGTPWWRGAFMEGRLCKLCSGVSNCMVGVQIWYQPKPPPMHLDCLNVVHTRKSSWRWYLLLLRLTKSAKREAEDWARQTKRTLGEPSLIKYQSNNISRFQISSDNISQTKISLISIQFKDPDCQMFSDGDDQAQETFLDFKTKAAGQCHVDWGFLLTNDGWESNWLFLDLCFKTWTRLTRRRATLLTQ